MSTGDACPTAGPVVSNLNGPLDSSEPREMDLPFPCWARDGGPSPPRQASGEAGPWSPLRGPPHPSQMQDTQSAGPAAQPRKAKSAEQTHQGGTTGPHKLALPRRPAPEAHLVTWVRVLKSRERMERSTSMQPMYCGERGLSRRGHGPRQRAPPAWSPGSLAAPAPASGPHHSPGPPTCAWPSPLRGELTAQGSTAVSIHLPVCPGYDLSTRR